MKKSRLVITSGAAFILSMSLLLTVAGFVATNTEQAAPRQAGQTNIWHPETIEEASQIAGYPVATPSYIPEGFELGNISVTEPPVGDLPARVHIGYVYPADRTISFVLIQDPTLKRNGSVGAEETTINGRPGQRSVVGPTSSNPHEILTLTWPDGKGGGFILAGDLAGPLTEEVMREIAASVGTQ